MQLHITISNTTDEKAWLDANANTGKAGVWNIPSCAEIGDMALIVVGNALYASVAVNSKPERRGKSQRKYCAKITAIQLIKPISFDEIRQRWPALTWAKYPRSYTTIKDKKLASQMIAATDLITI